MPGGTFGDIVGGFSDPAGFFGGGFDAFGKGESREQQRKLQKQQRKLAGTQEDILSELFGQTAGLREEGLGDLEEFLASGQLPTSLDVPFGSVRGAIGTQGQRAREDIISRTGARGGQLTDALVNQRLVEGDQQSRVDLLELPTRERLFQSALGIGTGTSQNTSSGLNSVISNLGSVSGQIGADQAQQNESLGQIAAIVAKFALA